jgi:hypothetical protein
MIRILNIAAVQHIPASNEVLDRNDSEGQKGEHESKNGWRHVFAFTCRALLVLIGNGVRVLQFPP